MRWAYQNVPRRCNQKILTLLWGRLTIGIDTLNHDIGCHTHQHQCAKCNSTILPNQIVFQNKPPLEFLILYLWQIEMLAIALSLMAPHQ